MTLTTFTPQYPNSLVGQIEEFLTREIIEGRIKAGHRLVESELQRNIGVSRSPIREAFRILEKNGYLVNVPRKGTYVREITEKDIRENFPVRAWLEGLAARLAALNLTDDDVGRLKEHLSKMEKAARAKDYPSYSVDHEGFHTAFINASRNDRLIEMVKTLRTHALWFTLSSRWHKENYAYAISIHKKITASFMARDADEAEFLVRKHILDNRDRYLEFLSEGGGTPSDRERGIIYDPL